ncbi:Uncharacterized protein SAPIO_CDS0906 [Scedosporium apiospermum]|uniref:Uncharacterized protein n=1 Tax=Pseudallescheria apiosperma TaxID=563466 RepID=A0A084GFE8_PSEDA|nr:Uncharacterized protein SAPIO_CDS0906 [Scedosporium apiospermum]KEZ46060.1 Uncharacterized protein SAPIO_CDS0906 [Scedosporium apiospermum]
MLRQGLLTTLSCLAAISGVATGRPVERRSVINHDAVVGFSETVPAGTIGELYLKYKPYLKVFNGCVPFPAVEADGDTSGGLSPSGSPEGGCSSSTGQVYVRSAQYGSAFAIMYSWYMPKDSPSSGLGHRHEWENIVVWLSGASTSASVLGVAVSQHGGHDKSTSPDMSGTHPTVGYISYWPVNHQLIFTSTVGGTQPLVAWENLTDAARKALTETDFGDATVPFKDSTFGNQLASAAL